MVLSFSGNSEHSKIDMKPLRLLLLIFFAMLLSRFSGAASVLSVDLDYMTEKAVVIFEGTPIDRYSRWNDAGTRIHTFIEFNVADVIKGTIEDSRLTLRFSGGTVGEMTLQIEGLEYPKIGEAGIYFVESVNNDLTNPIIGWSQGHFKVQEDISNTERMTTEQGNPVMSIDPTTSAQLRTLSSGTALGFQTGNKSDLARAMDKQKFKSMIRAKLGASE